MNFINNNLKILLMFLMSTAFVIGCDSFDSSEISVSADKMDIPAGGMDFTTITARVTKGGDPKTNQEVEFETTNGSFHRTNELDITTATTDENGDATVILYSDLEQGSATITVRYSDPDSGDEKTTSITIQFGEPTSLSYPNASKFTLTCSRVNLGTWIPETKPDLRIPCIISAQNMNNDIIPVQSLTLNYLTEAGVLEGALDYYSVYSLVYKTIGGLPNPIDVVPFMGEPERTCSHFINGSTVTQCNPRDGLTTLLAITRGSESFVDTNGNKEWDSGEIFTDIPEPFLDMNDDGIYQAATEPYFDCNENGSYDLGNGSYDMNTCISAVYKILWTGKLDDSPNASTFSFTSGDNDTSMLDNEDITFTVKAVDRNLNPLSTGNYDDDRAVSFSEDQYILPIGTSGSVLFSDIRGMSLDEHGLVYAFAPDDTVFTIYFTDSDPSSCDPDCVTESWDVGATVNYSAGPEGEYETYNSSSHTFAPIGGEINH
jgi:Bacterial Ig-like domain (group 1)